MDYTSFPKRLKVKTGNPVLDFYCKCLKSLNKPEILKGLDVCKVYVNQKDYKNLERQLRLHIKYTNKGIPKKTLDYQVGLFLLQYGPVEKNSVPTGIVYIDTKNLYGEEE